MQSFEDSLKLTKISLLLSGINTFHSKWNTLTTILFGFNILWLYVDVLGQFYWLIEGIRKGKSFRELTFIVPCVTISSLGTIKCTSLLLNRNLLNKTVDKLRNIYPVFGDDHNDIINYNSEPMETENVSKDDFKGTIRKANGIIEAEKEIVKDSLKLLTSVIKHLNYSITIVLVLFSFLPLISMAYHYYNTKKVELKVPYFVKYFFDPFTMKWWPFVYIHQVWSGFISGFNLFGADALHCTLCSYVQMHFRLLCLNIEKMDLRYLNPNSLLVPVVRRHKDLIKLASDVEIIYSKPNLCNIITSSMLICLCGFNVTVMENFTDVCAFLSFLVMSISQISILCLFGNNLMSSSGEVAKAIYKCNWYQADNSSKRTLLFILLRAQKPCKLTAAKFADINLMLLTTILGRSWSLFAVLRTVYHK